MLQAIGAAIVILGLLLAWTTIARWSGGAWAAERGEDPCGPRGRCLFCTCGRIPLDEDE